MEKLILYADAGFTDCYMDGISYVKHGRLRGLLIFNWDWIFGFLVGDYIS